MFLDYFKSLKADIICLQETHLTQKDLNTLLKEWNIEYKLSGTSTNSRGTAILINNTFEYYISNKVLDPDGRYIILELDIINLLKVAIINLYAPNKDKPDWFNALFKKVNKLLFENEIYVGDWNVLLTGLDRYNYNKVRYPQANSAIKDFLSKHNLIDIWRIQNLERKRYTWKTSNPCRRSRLDYFLITEDLLSLDPQTDILNAYRSDHNIISMSCLKSTQPRGKGLWKFNNSLLENKKFCSMIKKEINYIKSTYALPIYSPNYVETNEISLELSIPVTLFPETLLCQLRGQIIKFSKNLKKKEKESERKLIKDIEKLNKVIDSGINNNTLKDSLRARTLELENLGYKKIKGCIVRSQTNLMDNWEKP